jgi:predicted Zn-dependent protease with MMP-like domain
MDNEFEEYVEFAIKQLPREFQEKLDNVAIFVEDYPTQSQIGKFQNRGERTMLLGLYEGIPQTKRGSYGIGPTLPDKITLFRIPILSLAHSRENLIERIKDTLWHEIGHHFGMSEKELRAAEKQRGSHNI